MKNDEIMFICKAYQKVDIYIEFVESLKDKKLRDKIFDKLSSFKNINKYVISTDTVDYSQNDIKHINIIVFLENEDILNKES